MSNEESRDLEAELEATRAAADRLKKEIAIGELKIATMERDRRELRQVMQETADKCGIELDDAWCPVDEVPDDTFQQFLTDAIDNVRGSNLSKGFKSAILTAMVRTVATIDQEHAEYREE